MVDKQDLAQKTTSFFLITFSSRVLKTLVRPKKWRCFLSKRQISWNSRQTTDTIAVLAINIKIFPFTMMAFLILFCRKTMVSFRSAEFIENLLRIRNYQKHRISAATQIMMTSSAIWINWMTLKTQTRFRMFQTKILQVLF